MKTVVGDGFPFLSFIRTRREMIYMWGRTQCVSIAVTFQSHCVQVCVCVNGLCSPGFIPLQQRLRLRQKEEKKENVGLAKVSDTCNSWQWKVLFGQLNQCRLPSGRSGCTWNCVLQVCGGFKLKGFLCSGQCFDGPTSARSVRSAEENLCSV